MRRRFASLFLAFAALLWAAPVPAQPQPRPQPEPAAPAERPVLSLVIARAHSALPFPNFYGSACGTCLNPIHIAAFDSAQTLYGPPIAPEFGATLYWHSWFTYGNRPMLLVVQHLSSGGHHVVAYVRGPDADGMACLRREEIANLDWHPAGAAIVARDGELCASLAAIAALPPRPDLRTPITTMSVDQIRMTPPSLVVARRLGQRDSDLPPCPADETCWNLMVDARMADVETLSGPRVPRSLIVRLASDSPIPAGRDLIMVVTRDRGRLWRSQWFRALETGRDTCFPSMELWGLGLREARFSYSRDDETCIHL